MNRRFRSLSLLVAGGVAAVVAAAPAGLSPAGASEPATSTLAVENRPGTARADWTGTVQPGTNPTSECTLPSDEASRDTHELAVTVPDMGDALTYSVTFKVVWENADADLILTVLKDNEVVASSDGGEPEESITAQELGAGTYTVVVCPFASAVPADYTGSAVATTVAANTVRLDAPAPARGLGFSASVPADIQRDEGEPLIEIDPKGRTYTCGPTGFSQAEDYAQVSTDGGDQFHLLGEPPRGQQSLGGGGDCALAIAPEPNDAGNHQLSYVGLSGLLEFATATSPDGGQTFQANAVSRTGAGVDRQWTTATSTDRVLLSFNRAAPVRQIEVCTSTDAGLTYPDCQVVSPAPLFPGPIKSMPGGLNPVGDEPLVYYPWTQGTTVKLAVSTDDGVTWNNCLAATTEGRPGVLFPVADHDEDGNIYLVYGDEADFNTRMTTLRNADLARCRGGTGGEEDFKDNPGFSRPVVVNREPLLTTAFPWIAAGGEPGRVGIAFYGTQTDGRADLPDPKTWNVYVNQSLNALSAAPAFSQVKATTHPNHYDQVCLLGIGCSAGGDRSLVDFFAIDYNPVTGEYVVVFNRAHKRPDDEAGTVSTPVVFRQISGPSNGGGTVDRDGRRVLRRRSSDPTGDALADYSSLFVPPRTTNLPAADLTDVRISPAVDPATGDPLDGGGFTVTMTVDDLSDEALAAALAASGVEGVPAPSLLYLFRFVDGYRYAAAQANYDPVRGFTFGYSDYGATPSECGSPETEAAGDQCLTYYGDQPIPGAVDQEAGTITLTVPLEMLQALRGGEGPGERPKEVPARAGDRIYSAAAFSQSNPFTPEDNVQSFLYPLDNTPAQDFRIPAAAAAPGDGDGDGTGGGGGDDDDDGNGGGGGAPVLPATGQSLVSLLGLVLLGLGGWTALRRTR